MHVLQQAKVQRKLLLQRLRPVTGAEEMRQNPILFDHRPAGIVGVRQTPRRTCMPAGTEKLRVDA